MKLFLKEPLIEDKDEIVRMCEEFRNSNDEYEFEGLSNFKNITADNYEEK